MYMESMHVYVRECVVVVKTFVMYYVLYRYIF